MTRRSLAEFELLIMLAISRLRDGAYGGAILKEITQRAGREVSIGALYATLARLEAKGLVTMREQRDTVARPGRPRKYCTLTDDGLKATRASTDMLARMMDGLVLPEGAER